MTRKEAREQAFILIFQNSFKKESFEELLETAYESGIYIKDEYCESVVKLVIDNTEQLGEIIDRLAKGWRLDRISRVAQATLRVAIAEMLFFSDIPNGVSINEAVELTKKYATQDDASFVNGILGAFSKECE